MGNEASSSESRRGVARCDCIAGSYGRPCAHAGAFSGVPRAESGRGDASSRIRRGVAVVAVGWPVGGCVATRCVGYLEHRPCTLQLTQERQ